MAPKGSTGRATIHRQKIHRWAITENAQDPTVKNQGKVSKGANLPAGLPRKASDLHAVSRPARTRMRTLRGTSKLIALTSAACELNSQAGSI